MTVDVYNHKMLINTEVIVCGMPMRRSPARPGIGGSHQMRRNSGTTRTARPSKVSACVSKGGEADHRVPKQPISKSLFTVMTMTFRDSF
jgi:hypothetical protein